MSDPDLLKGYREFSENKVKQGEEALMGHHLDQDEEAIGTAAELKRDTLHEAAIDAMDESGPNTNTALREE